MRWYHLAGSHTRRPAMSKPAQRSRPEKGGEKSYPQSNHPRGGSCTDLNGTILNLDLDGGLASMEVQIEALLRAGRDAEGSKPFQPVGQVSALSS